METETKTIVTNRYAVGDRVLAMINRHGGPVLEPGIVVDTYLSTNQRGDDLRNVVVDFGDGQQRRYVEAGLWDYMLKVVPA